MSKRARFTEQMVTMTEPATKSDYVKRAEELGVSYGLLARKALDAYRASGQLAKDDGRE